MSFLYWFTFFLILSGQPVKRLVIVEDVFALLQFVKKKKKKKKKKLPTIASIKLSSKAKKIVLHKRGLCESSAG
jgi:hypothetical protein